LEPAERQLALAGGPAALATCKNVKNPRDGPTSSIKPAILPSVHEIGRISLETLCHPSAKRIFAVLRIAFSLGESL
jgi:hypothetical protein